MTIFPKREEQLRLIRLLEEWGFKKWGTKTSTGEEVYVRDFTKKFDIENPKITYPFISLQENNKVFIVPIWPDYHTELLPDSILRTESPDDFKEDKPHRNAISKVYISRSLNRDIKKGDIVLFYRTAEKGENARYSALITSIGIVEDKVDNIQNEQDFIMKAGKRSIFTNKQLKDWWDYNPNHRPFLIYFLHVYSLTPTQRTKLIRKKLLELGILTGEDNELRGLKEISKENLKKIINFLNTRIFKFLGVGGFCAGLSLIFLYIFTSLLNINYLISSVITIIITNFIGFALNKYYTFQIGLKKKSFKNITKPFLNQKNEWQNKYSMIF